MIEQVGFFHFVESYGEPLCELSRCLETQPAKRKGEALIVLPEGFNLGRRYNIDWRCEAQTRQTKPRFSAHCMVEFLDAIAKARSLVFVVGLIEGDHAKRNSAYLIDGKNPPLLMCRKMNNDHSGEYEPCKGECQFKNPHDTGGVYISALLCMDAERQAEGDDEVKKAANCRRDHVLSALGRNPNRRLLCVPAAFASSRSWTNDKYLSGKGIIVANSTTACASAIVNQEGELVKEFGDGTNRIVLVDVDQVASRRE
jgi:predicted amidohydrolase